MDYFSSINIWAVIVAAVISMPVGYFWYSNAGFGKPWAKMMGFDMTDEKKMKEMKEQMMPALVATFVSFLIISFFLAQIIALKELSGVVTGLKVGFAAWLGFVAPTLLIANVWSSKTLKLYPIDVSHMLVVMLVQAAIISVWL